MTGRAAAARVCVGTLALCLAARLFEEETFGGNRRTCVTCHSRETDTFSPADVQRRLQASPADPLFRHDGLDDGVAGTPRFFSTVD